MSVAATESTRATQAHGGHRASGPRLEIFRPPGGGAAWTSGSAPACRNGALTAHDQGCDPWPIQSANADTFSAGHAPSQGMCPERTCPRIASW